MREVHKQRRVRAPQRRSLKFPQRPLEGGTAEPGAAPHPALSAIEGVSRRIGDLARQLNCLGFYDDDDNRPRAA
jgi:hypothetical protein